MEENKVVIDASVAAKWILKEEGQEKALKIKRQLRTGEMKIFVTTQFYFELGNIIFRKIPALTLNFLLNLKASKLITCALSKFVMLKSLELMEKYPKISFYDASYHALAMAEEGTFITADKKYYDTTKKEGYIQLLKDFKI